MTNYLEAAAALVKKVADDNESRWSSTPGAAESGRVQCAKLYALFGAIDKGILPAPMAEEIYGQLRSKTNR